MKKSTLIALLLLFVMTFANAQTDVHIVNWVYGALVETPDTINGCMDVNYWTTNVPCDSYTWSRNDDEGGSVNDELILIIAEHPFTLYLTAVLDDIVYQDSLCFVTKDWMTPMEDFHMEIDGTGHAVFSGIATSEHKMFFAYRSLDTINWRLVCENYLLPGAWSWRDDDAHFGQDTVWNYRPAVIDTCDMFFYPEMIPGMMMGTQPAPGGGWYLTLRSILQPQLKGSEDYIYPLFTVDSLNNRHPFVIGGEQVILPASANSYLIPGRHPDAYYQGAVAKLSSDKDNEYEILSYSNKVENPLPEVDAIDDHIIETSVIKVYPNPSRGTFIIESNGVLTVTNVFGQVIQELNVDGQVSITLPRGVYIIRNGDAVKKVVVE